MKARLRAFLHFLSPQRPSEPSDLDGDESWDPFDPDAGLSKAERARQRTMQREKTQRFLAEHPNHPTVERIVDNRVFLLGLDQLYRTRMKRHESTELLTCARAVAAKLNVRLADVPTAGYYAETRRLTEYFRLIRALQNVRDEDRPHVARMREFQRLSSVVSSPLYGRPVQEGWLVPRSRDPLMQALDDAPAWTVDTLVQRACRVAVQGEDFSLVGLASIAQDAVVLAALRESVVLYADVSIFSREPADPPVPVYVWRVDEEVARRAARFVATFNDLFDEDLPEPVTENADLFFEAADEDEIIGRCVCIGATPQQPRRYYHWGIHRGPDGPAVEDFWDTELWTSDDYRDKRAT